MGTGEIEFLLGTAFRRTALGYCVRAMAFSAALFRMRRVEPFVCTICRFFRSANKRVAGNRDPFVRRPEEAADRADEGLNPTHTEQGGAEGHGSYAVT